MTSLRSAEDYLALANAFGWGYSMWKRTLSPLAGRFELSCFLLFPPPSRRCRSIEKKKKKTELVHELGKPCFLKEGSEFRLGLLRLHGGTQVILNQCKIFCECISQNKSISSWWCELSLLIKKSVVAQCWIFLQCPYIDLYKFSNSCLSQVEFYW